MTMEDLDYYFGKLKSRVAFHEEILNSLFPVLLLPIVPMSILAILVGIIKCVSIPVEEIFMFTFILWSIVFLWYEKYVIDLRIKVERVEKIVKERQILR
jgi:hypothetical protein